MLCLTHQIHSNRFFRNFQLHFGKFEVELNGQISHQCTISCHEPQCLKLSYVRHWGIFCRPGRIHWGIIMPRIHYRAIMSTTWHDIRKLFKLDTTHNSRMDSRLQGSPCEIQATYEKASGFATNYHSPVVDIGAHIYAPVVDTGVYYAALRWTLGYIFGKITD